MSEEPAPGVSVLIPSHGRPAKLSACLASLAAQERRPEEVQVVLDGGTAAEAAALRERFGDALGGALRVEAVPRDGLMPARVRLLAGATRRICLSLNDDVVAAPSLVRAHHEAHAASGRVRVVTGPCQQLPAADAGTADHPACLLDRLSAETGLIFFDATEAAATGTLSHRHVYGLNFSAPTRALRGVGGFRNLPNAYGYEDLELAFRLEAAGAKIHFEAEAAVSHRHRLGFEALLKREGKLGQAAFAHAGLHPAFGLALFGRDIRAASFLRFCREAVEVGAPDAERNRAAFRRLCQLPADTLPAGSPLLAELPQFWVPLKRHLWRLGLLRAADRG